MKTFLGLLVGTLLVTACGANDNSSSEVQGLRPDRSVNESIINNVKVKSINGGINPDAFAYVISGRMNTGSNVCDAKGVKVFLKEVKVNDQIEVIPMMSSPNRAGIACTQEYMPQYENVSITVRANHSTTSRVIIKNVEKSGESKDAASFIEIISETVVSNYKADPLKTVAGHFGYKITGTVLLGTNSCFAGGKTAEFRVDTIGNKVSVTALIKSNAASELRFCPMHYQPVLANIEAIVSGKRSVIKKIEILNVDQLDSSKVIDLK